MLSTQRNAQKEDVDGESVSMWFKVMQKKYTPMGQQKLSLIIAKAYQHHILNLWLRGKKSVGITIFQYAPW